MRSLKIILGAILLIASLFAFVGAWHAFAEPPRSWFWVVAWLFVALLLNIGAALLLKVRA